MRGGKPLQMINPRAPQRYYGTPDETFTYDSYNPSHVTGLILLGRRWLVSPISHMLLRIFAE